MADIVVTTPKSQMATAVQEAERAKTLADIGVRLFYFRSIGRTGSANIGKGSRVYYVEDGYVRGFGVVESEDDILYGWNKCDTTGRVFDERWYVHIPADTWQWIVPIPYTGFQGWRYAPDEWRNIEILGDWLDPKPMSE